MNQEKSVGGNTESVVAQANPVPVEVRECALDKPAIVEKSRRGGKRVGAGRPPKFNPTNIPTIEYKNQTPELVVERKKIGRPPKYTPEFIEKEADALLEYAAKTDFPFEFEFAPMRGYYRELLAEWAVRNDIFALALKQFKSIQLCKLVRAGLSRTRDVTMVIFTLKNVAGWRDRNEISGYIEGNETEADKSERRKNVREFLKGLQDSLGSRPGAVAELAVGEPKSQ